MKSSLSCQAEKELSSSTYFHRKKDGTWALSVYSPLKWGVVGTGAIADDVCEVINLIPGANPFWACAAKDSQKDADEFAEKHGEPPCSMQSMPLQALRWEACYLAVLSTSHLRYF